ncbi:hypothetical protein SPRG_14541 [Saprolegnia parasitica CBS 223.65]|uniref:Uncharacterized protein n=1 Tax=Saprolegnia parasitica (strain CBS 223.65) TaxID=695850 RepID=A0A067BS71_SAPPC|nr:hypothetical protein SPRG_14541 [Saprolegnia parasitica CBS 223.65]KDO19640.1 hypothetical protein SPRG_14541 [Saprolegnia parasitica CBS 223.65]|eukprot:XP_012209641.1 hypothetical protein SPRG_14541 [Saprolegnia parasitica CBS 223.65]
MSLLRFFRPPLASVPRPVATAATTITVFPSLVFPATTHLTAQGQRRFWPPGDYIISRTNDDGRPVATIHAQDRFVSTLVDTDKIAVALIQRLSVFSKDYWVYAIEKGTPTPLMTIEYRKANHLRECQVLNTATGATHHLVLQELPEANGWSILTDSHDGPVLARIREHLPTSLLRSNCSYEMQVPNGVDVTLMCMGMDEARMRAVMSVHLTWGLVAFSYALHLFDA